MLEWWWKKKGGRMVREKASVGLFQTDWFWFLLQDQREQKSHPNQDHQDGGERPLEEDEGVPLGDGQRLT
jgi:hypothetical protein